MINRRNFLKLGAATAAGASVLVNKEASAQAAHDLQKGGKDYSFLSGTERDSVPTACSLCASHCAALAYLDGGYVVKVEGQPESLRTLGKVCAKGHRASTWDK